MTVVMAMVDGFRMNAARGGHHRAGQRNAHQGDDQFLVHGVVPFLFGCLGLACDQTQLSHPEGPCCQAGTPPLINHDWKMQKGSTG